MYARGINEETRILTSESWAMSKDLPNIKMVSGLIRKPLGKSNKTRWMPQSNTVKSLSRPSLFKDFIYAIENYGESENKLKNLLMRAKEESEKPVKTLWSKN